MNHKRRVEPSPRDWEIWQSVKDDLMDSQYEGLVGYLQRGGHRQVAQWAQKFDDQLILDLGAGIGHHLQQAQPAYQSRYIGVDIDFRLQTIMKSRYANVPVINADILQLPFKTASTQCVISIYNLEHLRNLDDSLLEISRVLASDGELLVGLPLEGGALYGVGRSLTTKRYMERTYGVDYDKIVHWEHWSTYDEVLAAIARFFHIVERTFFPFAFLPNKHLNAISCIRARKRSVT